jgi:hypothetical protein
MCLTVEDAPGPDGMHGPVCDERRRAARPAVDFAGS